MDRYDCVVNAKRCSRCGDTKPREQFNRQSAAADGLHRWCKSCIRARQLELNPPKGRDRNLARNGEKPCLSCGERKPVGEFFKKADAKDGLASRCKACLSAQRKAAYRAKADQVRERVRRYRQANAEAIREKERSDPKRKRRLIERNWTKRGMTPEQIRAAFPLLAEPCFYCGAAPGRRHGIDHVVSETRGGTHDITNLVPCCHACNVSKHAEPLLEWNARRFASATIG